MSDQPTTANTNVKPSSASKPKRARKSAPSGFTIPDVARAYLKARGVTAPSDARIDKTCKVVRGIIRAHKSTLAKADPAIKRHTKGADYGRVNARTRDAVVKNVWKD